MTIYEFGDVILVTFSFTDQTSSKKRPAIVVSSNLYNQRKPDLIAIAATSQISSPNQFGELTITDWSLAGFIKPSIIKPVLITIEKNLVIRRLGKLQSSDSQKLQNLLQVILG